jgi:2,3-bisphosphoglycerate-dependent phosphoglycerate mutase
MERGRKVVDLYLNSEITLLVTHGNLLALILKSFEAKIRFIKWRSLSYSDLFEIKAAPNESKISFQKIR